MHKSVFKSPQTKEIISYVEDNYAGELEFLWERSPKNAIFRNKGNRKWYAVLLVITGDKIGLPTNDEIEILDIMFDRHQARSFAASSKNIYPGYHMNKDNWITIVLDYSLPSKDIFPLIDKSFAIAAGK